MKLRIFLRIYGIPVFLGIILILSLFWEVPVFKTFVRIFFFASILFSALLSDTKYIQDISVENDKLVIIYITQFLKTRTIEIPRDQIAQVKLPGWIIFSGIWPPALHIKVDDRWMLFSISGKRKYSEVQSELASAQLVKSFS